MKVYEDRYTATAIISGACDSVKEVKEIKGSARTGPTKILVKPIARKMQKLKSC